MSNVVSMSKAAKERMVDEHLLEVDNLFDHVLAGHPRVAEVPVYLARKAHEFLSTPRPDFDPYKTGGIFRIDTRFIAVPNGPFRMDLLDAGYRLEIANHSTIPHKTELTSEIEAIGDDVKPFFTVEVTERPGVAPFSERFESDVFLKVAEELYGADAFTPILFGVAYLLDLYLHLTSNNSPNLRRVAFSYDGIEKVVTTKFVDKSFDYDVRMDFKEIERQEVAFADRHGMKTSLMK